MDPRTPNTKAQVPSSTTLLWQYYLLSCVLVMVNLSSYFSTLDSPSWMAMAFYGITWFVYAMAYLLPAVFLLLIVRGLGRWIGKMFQIGGTGTVARGTWYGLAVLAFSSVQMILYTDKTIYKMFGFHLNGFVWNLLVTPGGISSMGGDESTQTTTVLTAGIIVGLELALLAALLAWKGLQKRLLWSPVVRGAVVWGLLALFGLQLVAYGLSTFYDSPDIPTVARSIPGYCPVTFTRLATRLGLHPPDRSQVNLRSRDLGQLQYPLEAIQRKEGSRNYNLVWLVAESLRADMLDPEIMPTTWKLAQKAQWFTRHYSGGNGTRMGLFAMFYGLYGNYWFEFLRQQRPPALIELLQQNGYQFGLYTSARFTYPEFDKTVFAGIPAESLHEYDAGMGWERDRKNVGDMLQWIDQRDPARPFMSFLFYESPHARYYFPPENIIRKDYLEEFNYATVDLHKNISLIRNRYINSCNHLDTQVDRVMQYLGDKGLLDSTIVIFTGDHGEEFMEPDHWGHNSDYTDPQVRTPMVIWVPGMDPHKIDRLTSHLDLPVTVMTLLGVTTPPREYSLGYDLFGSQIRRYTIMSGWDDLAMTDDRLTVHFPLKAMGFSQQTITPRDPSVTISRDAFTAEYRPVLMEIMTDMSRFSWQRKK